MVDPSGQGRAASTLGGKGTFGSSGKSPGLAKSGASDLSPSWLWQVTSSTCALPVSVRLRPAVTLLKLCYNW